MQGKWIAWILVSTLLPASPFLFLGKKGMDDATFPAVIILAVIAQLVCSALLAVEFAKKRGRGTGHIILLTWAFMTASVAIGTASFFASCVMLGSVNFH